MLFDDPANLEPDQILEWLGFCSTTGNQLSGRLSILFNKADQLWKVPLYEDGILNEWKWYIQNSSNISSSDRKRMIENIGEFKQLLSIRHWVAHGRYWTLKRNIKSYPPSSVAKAIEDLHQALADAVRHGNLGPFL